MSWKPFSERAAWQLKHVVHLHRRAAWAATWEEIERDLQEGVSASLGRLVAPASTKLHPGTSELADAAVQRNSVQLLKAAWVNEMWHGSDPLGEQLTLMWANHFATGFQKVQDCRAMFDQYRTLRSNARAPFGDLLRAMVRDQALLIWLDGNSNRKGHCNENLARELMELFTLGEGEYSESDVREAARALTGWTVKKGEVTFDRSRHDAGPKHVLGQTGAFDADGVVDLLLDHPATSRRLAWRICDHFLGRDRVEGDAVDALAELLRQSKLDVGRAVQVVLRSERFFGDDQLGARYASPASFVVSNLRALELHGPQNRPAVVPQVAGSWMQRLGQDLFQPPSVGGWTGGSTWISTGSMIDRARFSLRVADGTLHARAPACDVTALAGRHGQQPETFSARLLFGIGDQREASLTQLLSSSRAQFD